MDEASSPEDFYPAPPLESPESPESLGSPPSSDDDLSWGDLMLKGELSPRHRKLAELAASGKSNNEIAEILKYTPSRVSILKSNSRVKHLISEISERIYQETVGDRLKKMAEPALNEIYRCITDDTNRYKEQLKVETSKWVVEKIDGKAVQKHDIGENMLSVLMDRLDAIKASGSQIIDVSPNPGEPLKEITQSVDPIRRDEDDLLRDWARSFSEENK